MHPLVDRLHTNNYQVEPDTSWFAYYLQWYTGDPLRAYATAQLLAEKIKQQ